MRSWYRPRYHVHVQYFMTAAADDAKIMTRAIAIAITDCSTLLIGTGFDVDAGPVVSCFGGKTVSNVDSSIYIAQDFF